jgi:microcystin-dependent protein
MSQTIQVDGKTTQRSEMLSQETPPEPDFKMSTPSSERTAMKRTEHTLLGLLMLSQVHLAFTAEPPHLIPFQGHLARPVTGEPTQFEPVPAGRYDILFTLYAAPVGGESKVWGPERHAQVTVVNGLVNALLGSVIGFEDAVAANRNFFARSLYVGITIDADGNPNTADLELLPRQVLLPAVYALNANKLDGYDWHDVFSNGDPTGTILSDRIADQSITAQQIAPQTITASQLAPATLTAQQIAQGTITAQQIAAGTITGAQIADNTITAAHLDSSLQSDSIVPPGTIVAFGGSTAPAGWLLCDGSAVKQGQYARLFNPIAMTWGAGEPGLEDDFSLPDLKGRVPVGAGVGDLTPRTLGDSGGAEQYALNTGQIPSHFHATTFAHNGYPDGSGDRTDGYYIMESWRGAPRAYNTSPAGNGEPHPNMPPFRVVNYIIKD